MFDVNIGNKLFIVALLAILNVGADTFHADIGHQMTIGGRNEGYKSVKLKCGSNSMQVAMETEDGFDGVIYTRGNFHGKHSPCFLDSSERRGQKRLSLKFPLDQCNTVRDGERYSNVIVLQHDKELVMPGDAAFRLECDYSRPRDVAVSANLRDDTSVKSSITLTDADPPLGHTHRRNKRSGVENGSDTVVLTPHFLKRRKEEL